MSDSIHSDIINAVDEFDYSTQSDSYNEKFRSWRKNKNNPFAFRFEKNLKERIYIDGRGFIDKSMEKAEKQTILNIMRVLGNACLMYIVFDVVISQLLVWMLSCLGVDVYTNFSSRTIAGGSHEVTSVLIALGLLRVFIPTIYLHCKFKVPAKVEVMQSPNNPAAIIGAISIMLLFCIVISLPNAYSTDGKEVYQYFSGIGTDTSVWNQAEFLIYTIFDTIVVPIAMQLFFCGAMFAVLRQFGDIFAILITSVTAAILTQDILSMPAMLIVCAIASYGMLASGTMFAAASVHIVYKLYILALTILEFDRGENMPITRNIFMCIILVIGGLGTIIYIRYVNKKNIRLAKYYSEQSFGRRTVETFKIFPYSAAMLICLMHALVKAVM